MRCLALLLLPSMLHAIDCKHQENTVDQAICTLTDLRTLDRQIEAESSALKAKLTGENAATLADTEMPFLRQRNDCSNQVDDIPGCVRKILTARLDLLNRTQQDPNAIRGAIAQSNYIDISFLWKYWPQLIGRKLSVWGCLMPDDNQKTRAMLETENQPPVPLQDSRVCPTRPPNFSTIKSPVRTGALPCASKATSSFSTPTTCWASYRSHNVAQILSTKHKSNLVANPLYYLPATR